MNLSGGQMQKIALARAILKSPELLLLDEPTSSLDNISEEHIMSALKTYDIAMIVVSHRLSTIKHFDKIIVMNEGKIQEIGTHEGLLSKKGLYAGIYKREVEHTPEKGL